MDELQPGAFPFQIAGGGSAAAEAPKLPRLPPSRHDKRALPLWRSFFLLPNALAPISCLESLLLEVGQQRVCRFRTNFQRIGLMCCRPLATGTLQICFVRFSSRRLNKCLKRHYSSCSGFESVSDVTIGCVSILYYCRLGTR